jgi:hypothetical protein
MGSAILKIIKDKCCRRVLQWTLFHNFKFKSFLVVVKF